MRLCLLVISLVLIIACSNGGNLTPGIGTIEITTATSGPDPDPDGYTISLDGVNQGAIGAAATLRLENLLAGTHQVQLGGVAANCTVAGENPRAAGVIAGQTTPVGFQVACVATTGDLEVTAVTSGAAPDPDGYILSLDGKDRLRIGVNETVTFSRLQPGGHTVGLGDIAGNCQVQGDNPRSVTVTGGAGNTVTFSIDCTS